MKKIATALALVGALGLFAACGESGDTGTTPEGPGDTPTETVDVKTPDVDAPSADEIGDTIEDIKDSAADAVAEFKTVELSIDGMT